METKLDHVARESNLLQLHDTIDEKEEDLQRAQARPKPINLNTSAVR